jgi:hypothetical protein
MSNRPTKYVTGEVHIEEALAATAIFPTLDKAKAFLRDKGYRVDTRQLARWRDVTYADRYQEVRRELAPKLEEHLILDQRDNVRLAVEVERIALERTKRMLKAGELPDPARVARDVSQTRSQGIDKILALEGRPSRIVENRDVKELVNALVGMGVAEEVIQGEAREITAGAVEGQPQPED